MHICPCSVLSSVIWRMHMIILEKHIVEYRKLYKECFGIDITLEDARQQALHLLKVIHILEGKL